MWALCWQATAEGRTCGCCCRTPAAPAAPGPRCRGAQLSPPAPAAAACAGKWKWAPACVLLCCSLRQQLLALPSPPHTPSAALARALITADHRCSHLHNSAGLIAPLHKLAGLMLLFILGLKFGLHVLAACGEESAAKRRLGPLLSVGAALQWQTAVQIPARACQAPPCSCQRLPDSPHSPAWLGRISHQGQSVSTSSRDSGTAAIVSRLLSVLREQPFIPMLQQQRTRRGRTSVAHQQGAEYCWRGESGGHTPTHALPPSRSAALTNTPQLLQLQYLLQLLLAAIKRVHHARREVPCSNGSTMACVGATAPRPQALGATDSQQSLRPASPCWVATSAQERHICRSHQPPVLPQLTSMLLHDVTKSRLLQPAGAGTWAVRCWPPAQTAAQSTCAACRRRKSAACDTGQDRQGENTY